MRAFVDLNSCTMRAARGHETDTLPYMSTTELSLAAAARECNVSRPTIQRAIKSGKLPNCWQNEKGHWRIPVPDLLGAGFNIAAPAPPAQNEQPVQHESMKPDDTDHAHLHARVSDLEAALERETSARKIAEALAEERLARIEDLKSQLPQRSIEGGQTAKRGIFSRLFG